MAAQTQHTVDFSWMEPIKAMLGAIDYSEAKACSIYRVSDKLRKPNEKAFRPKEVSVGPLHRGTSTHLQLMEEHKWRYTLSFLQGKDSTGHSHRTKDDHETKLRKCGQGILKLDDLIRASYGGQLQLDSHELAKLMIVDGCFVLELLRKLREYKKPRSKNDYHFKDDPIFGNKDKLSSIQSDLMLLENQVPFIVLKKLYRKVFPTDLVIKEDHRVAHLFLSAFSYASAQNLRTSHLLHLVHVSTVNQKNNKMMQASPILKRCATQLRASGIKIQRPNSDNKNARADFVDNFDCNISFNGQDGVLIIPPLHIKETTEVMWRNLIAWEQSGMEISCRFSSYAMFFKCLICCKHDIGFLESLRVIVYKSGKNKDDLLKLFRTITDGVEHMDLSYKDDCESMNKHGGANLLTKWSINTWHRCNHIGEKIELYGRKCYAKLKKEHISSIWKFIGVMAAAALLALTIAQVYYAARADAKSN